MSDVINGNVLSLFDGMSCGQIALNQKNINYNNYYSSEIKDNAIFVTKLNYPDTIQIGDVNSVNVDSLPKIDLLLGGSPCQGFSISGKGFNFNDPRSSLFFKYVEILRLLRYKNPNIKFLLENVPMKNKWLDIISNNLGVQPIRINSSKYTAQKRARYYWFNWDANIDIDTDNIVFEDIMDNNVTDESLFIPDKYKFDIKDKPSGSPDTTMRIGGYKKQGQGQRLYSIKGKSVCLTANGGGWGAKTGLYLTSEGIRQPTINELCRLQGVPTDYFEGSGLSYSQVCNLIGDGWTIPVISNILNGLISE